MHNRAFSVLGWAPARLLGSHPEPWATPTDEDAIATDLTARPEIGSAGVAIIGCEGSAINRSSSTVSGAAPPSRNHAGHDGRAEAKYEHASRFVNQPDMSRRVGWRPEATVAGPRGPRDGGA
jgi:hypothetical protein